MKRRKVGTRYSVPLLSLPRYWTSFALTPVHTLMNVMTEYAICGDICHACDGMEPVPSKNKHSGRVVRWVQCDSVWYLSSLVPHRVTRRQHSAVNCVMIDDLITCDQCLQRTGFCQSVADFYRRLLQDFSPFPSLLRYACNSAINSFQDGLNALFCMYMFN